MTMACRSCIWMNTPTLIYSFSSIISRSKSCTRLSSVGALAEQMSVCSSGSDCCSSKSKCTEAKKETKLYCGNLEAWASILSILRFLSISSS